MACGHPRSVWAPTSTFGSLLTARQEYDTFQTLKDWATEMQQKGILLVPVSAIYKGRSS